MTKGIHLAIWRQPAPSVVGVGLLLILAGVWSGLVFPLHPYSADLQRDLALLVVRVLQLALCVALLQIALGFVVVGKNASADARCRTCMFSAVAVVVMLIGVSMVVVWHPITYDDLRWDMCGEGSWHEARHGFLLCAVPLLTGGVPETKQLKCNNNVSTLFS